MIDDDQVTEVQKSSDFNFKSKEHDPFNITLDDARKLENLSKNFKRRQDRKAKGFHGKDAKSKQITDEQFGGYGYLDVVTPPYNLSYLTKLYEVSPAHKAAVDAKVESVFGLGWEWVESPRTKRMRGRTRTESGRTRLEEDLETVKFNMTEWLEDINNIDTWDEIMKKIGKDYESTGNGYMEVGRTKAGRIGYIGHIPVSEMRIRRDRDGFVQLVGGDVVFFRNFGEKNINDVTTDPHPNEVIHFKKYSPASTYYGVPDIIAAKNALGGNEFASRYNLDFFENKAVPRHAIIVKGGTLSQTSLDKLLEFFESGLRGKHHRTLYVPLTSRDRQQVPEIEFKSIEADKQDFSFGAYRDANNEEIFMAHRTPPSRAGVFSKHVSLAASRDADKIFKEGYSRPEQEIFEKKMARVFREVNQMVVFRLNELSLVDEDTKSKIDERDVRMGIRVADEVRRERSLPPRPDGKGDEPYQPNSRQAAEERSKATAGRQQARDRSDGSTDSQSSTESRAPKGDGRAVE